MFWASVAYPPKLSGADGRYRSTQFEPAEANRKTSGINASPTGIPAGAKRGPTSVPGSVATRRTRAETASAAYLTANPARISVQ